MEKRGAIYVKSIVAGLVSVLVASFLTLEAVSIYLSRVYHLEMGRIGWNSDFVNPLNLLLIAAMFLAGFFWEFKRAR
jgi:hypothetical protein